MMTDEGFDALVMEIMRQGHSEEDAALWASLISDHPIRDERGKVVVQDGDHVLATLEPLKCLGME